MCLLLLSHNFLARAFVFRSSSTLINIHLDAYRTVFSRANSNFKDLKFRFKATSFGVWRVLAGRWRFSHILLQRKMLRPQIVEREREKIQGSEVFITRG